MSASAKAPRGVRRDAQLNRARILAAASRVVAREGPMVPLATIAAEAGVGVGTLYRRFADRDALWHALEHRAYDLLNSILDDIETSRCSGLDAIGAYLRRCVAIAEDLVLPLRGAPPLVTPEALAARSAIDRRLAGFLGRGRADGSISAAVGSADVVVFGSLVTQPPSHLPDWHALAERQISVFLAGLAAAGRDTPSAPPLTMRDIEAAFGADPSG